TELLQFPGEMVAARAGFHGDDGARHVGEMLKELSAREALFQHFATRAVETNDMEHVLCQVQANGRNIHLGLLLISLMVGTASIVAQLTPVEEGRRPSHRPTSLMGGPFNSYQTLL